MKYYLDTEFLEGTQDKRIFGFKTGIKTKPTIDLISIGIVSEDGREYYAISKDFNLKEAWNRYDLEDLGMIIPSTNSIGMFNGFISKKANYRIRDNVLMPIFADLCDREGKDGAYFSFNLFKKLINEYGKSNKQIAEEVKRFVYNSEYDVRYNQDYLDSVTGEKDINFYTYYGDYDWVVFCWLFGKMIDLPKGFPMYARDLKQIFDETCLRFIEQGTNDKKTYTVHCNETLKTFQKQLKRRASYPRQENEHNALADARWNKKLHEFLNQL